MSLSKAWRNVPSWDAKNLFQRSDRMAGILAAPVVDAYVSNTSIALLGMSNVLVKLGSTVMTARFKVCGRSKNSKTMRDGNVLLSVTCHRSA